MTAMTHWDFHGGIHPPECKDLSNRTPLQRMPLPAQLVVPLTQHLGAPAEPCVMLGEHVLKGQKIAEASGYISAPVHAPTSGTVSFIGPQPYPHVSGMLVDAIIIDSDGQDTWIERQPVDNYRALAASDLLEHIRQAGISGLGGAGFPTAVKLSPPSGQKIRALIINGTECEPYITADDLLMREKAAELVAGIEILAHLIQPEQVVIGIEDNKPEAVAAVTAAIGERPFQVRVFPTKYPSGGEKQLIQILTGEEVPSGGLPADIGMLCQNVGTCVAVHDAVLLGQPLISRITTLTGKALERPMNVEALIGTPVAELLAFAGLDSSKLNRLIMGGPMMGFTLPSLDVPLVKTTNCLLASTLAELPPPPPALPCIRCGDCAEVCPASLLPQQLHFFALGQEHEQLKAYNLLDCIECGACAYVCPSSIPLVQYYRAAKGEIRALEQKQQKAEHSRQRFEWRQERLRRAEEQKEADRKARAERASRAKAAESSSVFNQEDPVARVQAQKAGLSDQQKKLKIEASMANVALKKAEKQLAIHATPELEAQVAELRTIAANAQAALDQANAAAATAPAAPAPAPAANDDAAKKAKIQAAMLRAQVRKLEKLETRNADQDAELSRLQTELADAEKTLATHQGATRSASPKPASDDDAKKAKIQAAMLRAQVRKLENVETRDADQNAELSRLQTELADADRTLATLLDAAPFGATDSTFNDAIAPENSGIATLKKAKIELAMKRAGLKKAEAAGAEETELSKLRDGLASAEQALHEAEAQSGKPEPELVRTDKRPVDERTRALKTELAFARADLRKLEREGDTAADALEAARLRLSEAERQYQDHNKT